MQEKFPGRYVRNGYQPKMRELRTSLGPFEYRLAQLYDKQEKKTVVPLRESSFLPSIASTPRKQQKLESDMVHLSYRLPSKEIARIREAPAASDEYLA